MQKCRCSRVWGQQGANAMLNKRQACNKAIKGPTCSFKNMWDLNAMQKKHASTQQLNFRTKHAIRPNCWVLMQGRIQAC